MLDARGRELKIRGPINRNSLNNSVYERVSRHCIWCGEEGDGPVPFKATNHKEELEIHDQKVLSRFQMRNDKDFPRYSYLVDSTDVKHSNREP